MTNRNGDSIKVGQYLADSEGIYSVTEIDTWRNGAWVDEIDIETDQEIASFFMTANEIKQCW